MASKKTRSQTSPPCRGQGVVGVLSVCLVDVLVGTLCRLHGTLVFFFVVISKVSMYASDLQHDSTCSNFIFIDILNLGTSDTWIVYLAACLLSFMPFAALGFLFSKHRDLFQTKEK